METDDENEKKLVTMNIRMTESFKKRVKKEAKLQHRKPSLLALLYITQGLQADESQRRKS